MYELGLSARLSAASFTGMQGRIDALETVLTVYSSACCRRRLMSCCTLNPFACLTLDTCYWMHWRQHPGPKSASMVDGTLPKVRGGYAMLWRARPNASSKELYMYAILYYLCLLAARPFQTRHLLSKRPRAAMQVTRRDAIVPCR